MDTTAVQVSCLESGKLWKEGDWYSVHTIHSPEENCYILQNQSAGFRGAYKITWPIEDPAACDLVFDKEDKVYRKPESSGL